MDTDDLIFATSVKDMPDDVYQGLLELMGDMSRFCTHATEDAKTAGHTNKVMDWSVFGLAVTNTMEVFDAIRTGRAAIPSTMENGQ